MLANKIAKHLPLFSHRNIGQRLSKSRLADSLPGSRMAVLEQLLRHAGADRVAYPSEQRLARLTGRSTRTIVRAIKDLAAAGAILKVQEQAGRRHSINAYVLHPSLFVTPITSSTSSRKQRVSSPRPVLVIHDKQTRARAIAKPPPPAAGKPPPGELERRAIAELMVAGLSRATATRDVAAIGAAIVLRRALQARKRPAFAYGEVRNPAGYVRACIRRDYPPPMVRFRDPEARAVARRLAVAYAAEREHEAARSSNAVAARGFLEMLRERLT